MQVSLNDDPSITINKIYYAVVIVAIVVIVV